MKNLVIILIVLVLLLGGKIIFDAMKTPPQQWKPVLEGTNFEYLDEAIDDALKSADNTGKLIGKLNNRSAEEAMQHTLRELKKLKYYYIPITEVRQLIYDADRLYYLNNSGECLDKLENVRKYLIQISESGKGLEKPTDEVLSLTDEAVNAVKSKSPDAAEKLEKLGHRVNLMALKGQLILEEVTFK